MKPQQNPLSKLSPSIEEVVTDQLRELLPRLPTRTQQTREVANLLFFGHGIYPSAQLVRHFTQLMVDSATVAIICWAVPNFLNGIGCDVFVLFHGIK